MSARVLVVDDILPNVKLLEAKLSGEYFDVLTATAGVEALKIAEESMPDIVLLDVMMPGMDGFEVCERLKNNPKTAHIPVVMVTALTDATDRVRGLEAGADDFLSKPVNDTALLARVRSLVRLKMTIDEWRIRENTSGQFGVMNSVANEIAESVENARVLVVEDKSFESEKFVETMKRDDDIVMPVANGEQAIALAQQHDFDLITVSLNMMGEDGLRLCSHLRSNERTRSVPILMVGEEMDMPRIARGLEIGAHDYILRPVDRNELLARVRTQIRRKRYQDHLRSNYENSLNMALTDPLTGLFNRRYLTAHLEKVLASYKENKKSIGVLMMDIDHFKNFNDTYGHAVGDEVLKTFADRVAQRLRSFDLVARMGGEEFVAILPDITPKVAMQVAERLRRGICDEPMETSAPEGRVNVAVSIGGMIVNRDGIDPDEALKLADDALYEAKELGRNCSVFDGIGRVTADHIRNEPTEEEEQEQAQQAQEQTQEQAPQAQPQPQNPTPEQGQGQGQEPQAQVQQVQQQTAPSPQPSQSVPQQPQVQQQQPQVSQPPQAQETSQPVPSQPVEQQPQPQQSPQPAQPEQSAPPQAPQSSFMQQPLAQPPQAPAGEQPPMSEEERKRKEQEELARQQAQQQSQAQTPPSSGHSGQGDAE